MARVELPLACEGCGACCTACGCPPGAYLYLAILPPHLWPQWVTDSPDVGLWQRTPEAARDEVRAYRRDDIRPNGKPCIWLDPDTRRCRHYEHRPTVCRRFERGSGECLRMLERSAAAASPT